MSRTSPPPKKLKGLIRRRKSIGRQKDGRQKKPGSYDYASVRVSHGLHFTARSQEVLSAVGAQIFFDATTCRQVPFSAVVISLMGDTPESIDPVIVSSCVVLEDETSETQVDGIVSKGRHAFNHD